VKAIILAIIILTLPFAVQAEESEGLIQKAYKKFILKNKNIEQKPTPKPQETVTDKEIYKDSTLAVVGSETHQDASKAEIIQEIIDEVDSEGGGLEYVPKLKRENKDGKNIYSYLIDGKQVDLESVDEATLGAILKQIRSNARQEEQEQLDQRNALHEQQKQLGQRNDIVHSPISPPSLPARPPTVSYPPRNNDK